MLPAPDAIWPPVDHDDVHQAMEIWNAWFVGDRDNLSAVYRHAYRNHALPRNRPSQYRGGIVGRVSRYFWGAPIREGQEHRSTHLHIPAASDIASASAGLLFSEPPTITADDEATQKRLDELLDDRFWAAIIEGAAICAGIGGVFQRVCWDKDSPLKRPIVDAIGPDLAVPVFQRGQLVEVTFTWQLSCDQPNRVLRHLEHHTVGKVEHALYLGDANSLGQLVPLTDHPVTASLAGSVDEYGVIDTGLDRLDVVYVLNLPSRQWRRHPVGAYIGQPDIAGVEPLLDALDEAWSSWMRDIRLGKSRLILSQAWLTNHGPGKGASFDMDEELLVKVNVPPTQDAPVELVQPAIRHEEHAATCEALLERCVDGAGYSAQTFGLTGEIAMTATESDARERKTNKTRGAKIRYWKPGLSDLIELMLAVDAQVFGSGVKVAPPTIEFPPAASDGVEVLAQAAQLLRAAEAASTETLVRLTQPSLDDDELTEEVARIKDEQLAAMPPPLADPFDNPDAPGVSKPPAKPDDQTARPKPKAPAAK